MKEPAGSPLHAALQLALHDFRSGIVSMAAVLKMLQFRIQRLPAGDERTGALEEIDLLVRAAARLDQLIGRLEPIVRHAELTTPPYRHDMTALIREAVGGVRAGAVRLRLPDGPVDVRIDRGRVLALLREVVAAVEASSAEGLTIELDAADGSATISISWRSGGRRPEHDIGLLVAAVLAEQAGASWRLEPRSADELIARIECKL